MHWDLCGGWGCGEMVGQSTHRKGWEAFLAAFSNAAWQRSGFALLVTSRALQHSQPRESLRSFMSGYVEPWGSSLRVR